MKSGRIVGFIYRTGLNQEREKISKKKLETKTDVIKE